MKHLLIFILLISSQNVNSQNLVPNPSWELYQATYSVSMTAAVNNKITVCSTSPDTLTILNWYVTNLSPDRIIEGTAGCYDNDLAQDGDGYLILGNSESIKVALLDTLIENCHYHFSVWLNPETFRGTNSTSSRASFTFGDPAGNIMVSPLIVWNVWQSFSLSFTASASSTTLEIKNLVNNAGLDIDNISVQFLGCPLPLSYLSIKGGIETLTWQTATEHNLDRFEIYNRFGILAKTVKSKGAGTYLVTLPSNYYVLKSIDNDGLYRYSKMIYVRSKREEEINQKIYNYIGQEIE